MNYDKIAKIIGHKLIKYKTDTESLLTVYNKLLKEQGDFTSDDSIKIMTRMIHVITVLGYELESTHPLKLRNYLHPQLNDD